MIRLKVKELAQQKGYSQGLLGRMANVDTKTMQKIYRNPTTAVVTTPILDRLAKALKVDVSELLESIPDEEPKEFLDNT
ncbi:XRE family transcriptional regulator [Ktedonosporobacter rubrisoli]|uniref:XRE family transcriptional regulator n=1 Tax=Ktedonosporobacter rubrisoli TaxID=2509675 RepID=A0A4P6JMB7_KTERU|nr:helix-turn-helix transcriptional regulator [Ktedonosporobacter rubrisoli]QBD76427.1 XRE family transcriptional regulator [Ktedonosporobacter rubrisoli]